MAWAVSEAAHAFGRTRQRTDVTRALVDNEIGTEGARAVAEALKVNQLVTQIVLSGN